MRGKTITDDNVPSTLRSPTKRLAQSGLQPLQQSRSFSNLRSHQNEGFTKPEKPPTSFGEVISMGERTRPAKLRRRSTLLWSGTNPGTRQVKLEDAIRGRMVDSWFSLHVKDWTMPIYVSEQIEGAMNPVFRAFDLDNTSPDIARKSRLQLRLWAKPSDSSTYTLLVEIDVSLRSLQYVGKSLETFHHPLPPNSIIFHLSDGVYTSFTDLPAVEHPVNFMTAGVGKAASLAEESTSSFDALMRLANLDECIQDALGTRTKLESQINSLIKQQQSGLEMPVQHARAEDSRSQTEKTCISQRKQIQAATIARDRLKRSIATRKAKITEALGAKDESSTSLVHAADGLEDRQAQAMQARESSSGQLRRVCEDLLRIFPIEAIPDRPLLFTIHGLPLPNSKFDDLEDKESVAAALGYTAHLVILLSQYLSVPLPYPIQHFGSTTIIEDPISVALPQRVFPLYPISAAYRFEYGVFLLNKNIEFLMERHSLRMLDIRHTLPNLKYLLYVLTAGIGELPSRKAGGVKGLITGRMSPSLSRQSSEDSFSNGSVGHPSKGMTAAGTRLPISRKLREPESDNENRINLLYGNTKQGTTFRTSALRQVS